jgi:hypothetical protein
MIAVFCEKDTKEINYTYVGTMQNFPILKQMLHIVTITLEAVKKIDTYSS